MTDNEKFLLKEYNSCQFKPLLITLGNHKMIMPVSYANKYNSSYSFMADLLHSYIKNGKKELQKYEKLKQTPKYAQLKNIDIVVPANIAHLSDKEIMKIISDNVFAQYNKAIRTTRLYNQAFPNDHRLVNVSRDNIKDLSIKYNQFLFDKYKTKAEVAAEKLVMFLSKSIKSIYNSSKKFSVEAIKSALQTWKQNKNRNELLAKARKNKSKLIATSAILGGSMTLGSYLNSGSNQKDTDMHKVTVTQDATTPVIHPNLAKFLKENGYSNLSPTQKHNLNVYLETRNIRNVCIAFAEDYYPKIYDDGKGFKTIGYGSTIYLDANGKKLGDFDNGVPKDVELPFSRENAMEQVNRYSDFIILPQILSNVKTKMTPQQMVATHNFAYVVGDQFKTSSYLKALNNNESNSNLSQCLAMWNVDKGLPKRLFFAHLLLKDYISPKDFVNFKAGGCYDLPLDMCLVCNKNSDGSTKMVRKSRIVTKKSKGVLRKVNETVVYPDFKMVNNKPCFTDDPEVIQQCLKRVKSRSFDDSVANIVPPSYQNEKLLSFSNGDNGKTVNLLQARLSMTKNKERY